MPPRRALLESLKKMTTIAAVLRMARKNMADYLNRPLEEILELPEVRHVFGDIKLGSTTPAPPVLLVQAVHDKIIAVDDIDELAHTYMSGGAAVTYHCDMLSEHLLLHPMSAPMTLRWLRERFDGRPLSEHLVRTQWPTLFNPSTYRGMARLAVIAAKVITGRRVERRPLSKFDMPD
jgi:Secretory lipase